MICPSCGHDNVPGNDACGNCQQSMTPLDLPSAASRIEKCLMCDPVAALPNKPVVTVRPETSIRQAVDLMLANNVGATLVVDEAGKLLGIFSERDLLTRVVGQIDEPLDQPVGPYMTARPTAVSPTETLNYVLHKMDGGGHRHVPVVQNGTATSVISVRDMLRHILKLCRHAE
jgi:CBS domain-containing protein